MTEPGSIERRDRQLVQIVDAALADAAKRSGDWLQCRPGCTQCCVGVFAISPLDALRLRRGLAELEQSDPERAAQVRMRAQSAVQRLAPDFPGDAHTGLLDESEEAQACFEDFANDAVCPALAADGTCDLYEARPMTCRVFGPPVRTEEGLGVCELCFVGASADEIAACEMVVDPEDQEAALTAELERTTGPRGRTIVAFALLG
jgi:Fe-S-cluster containining protein